MEGPFDLCQSPIEPGTIYNSPSAVDRFLADCHLHFEGCLPFAAVERLARGAGHPFAERQTFERRRASVSDAGGFLSLYAEICRLFRRPEDYADAARSLVQSIAADGVRYAEIYVSPEIFARVGLESEACLQAIDEGFRSLSDRSICRILLDAVRHWGVESAERVLDLYERKPLPSIVGFGLGGDESATPAAEFAGVYARARALGLKTSVHAGEWGGADSVREALDCLRPDRLDHGIAAAADTALTQRLANEFVPLCIAPSGNVATGAVASWEEHPLPRLLSAGVCVALSADDALLFATTTANEYRRVREVFGLDSETLDRLARNSWRVAFCSPAEREWGLRGLAQGGEFAAPQETGSTL